MVIVDDGAWLSLRLCKKILEIKLKALLGLVRLGAEFLTRVMCKYDSPKK